MRTKTLVVILLVLFVSGCSGDAVKLITASGTVTSKGEPLADVRVEFTKKDTGALSFAETDGQGRFELRHTHGSLGAEPGTYLVSVFRKGKPISPPPGQTDPGEQGTTPDEPILMADKSPIEVVVTDRGPNEFVIDIR